MVPKKKGREGGVGDVSLEGFQVSQNKKESFVAIAGGVVPKMQIQRYLLYSVQSL